MQLFLTGSILKTMIELDDVWSNMLTEAIANARASGKHDVAEYLALKATNDQIREQGVKWLFDSLIETATESTGRNQYVVIEREDPHNFAYKGANIVGAMLRLRLGVRCLMLEAGWTRTPSDGFMRGGALAFAKLTHLGMKKANEELSLMHSTTLPEWYVSGKDESLVLFGLGDVKRHFETFIGN